MMKGHKCITTFILIPLTLIQLSAGLSSLNSQAKQVVAIPREDVTLPCHMEPPVDVSNMNVVWQKNGPSNISVCSWPEKGQLVNQHQSYVGRTSLLTDKLKNGNVSMTLKEVKLSDGGKYTCSVPELHIEMSVDLIIVHPHIVEPSGPIVALRGDSITLPCQLEPKMKASDITVEWSKTDKQPGLVYRRHKGVDKINESYKGRTSLFLDELKQGNISLNLFNVTQSDEGKYKCKCAFDEYSTEISLDVHVGAVSSPVITITGRNTTTGEVFLQCESKGWYPEPEVLWLDGEGKLLPAGPTETVRGPDDLYTVSSRVTVEKRHSNSFTCRVQQKNINQTRETHIHITDDFFMAPSNCAVSVTFSVVLSLMFIIAVAFSVWKWRQR
ncbi:butyrophilin subfamily 3 member A2-like [Trachinotus anak]|uniref:butyrophilin subfamily 3 member A2-like n=1 Tax=Trachinotus anak TaxID=443729 RepID=UPI0039F2092D